MGADPDPRAGTAVGWPPRPARPRPGTRQITPRRARYLAVLGLLVYLVVLVAVVPGFAIISAAVLPLAIHGVVDQTIEERDLQARRAAARDT